MSPNMLMETSAVGGAGTAFEQLFSGDSLLQNIYTAKGCKGMIAFSSSFPGSIKAFQITPVSYTHLDVYKRQTLSSYDFSSQAAELAYSMDDYEANVVIIGYPAEVAKLLIDSPTDAWYDVAEGYENVTILEEQGGDWTTEGANEIMRDFLTKYEDIDIVFAGSDAMAEGAALAIQQAGREGIQVWGLDGESKALEYIEDGLMTGTIYTNYYDMGTLAAQLAMYNIGSTVDLNKQDDMYYYCFPSEIVTADNVETITERW